MFAIRRSGERGHANHGWLDSRHTFSFAGYRDPRFMGFSHLRVINQDRVAPHRGFGTHPHQNMEIISYVIRGALAHKDTLGNGSSITPGDVQLMSAGTGISHSEMNPSSEEVEFLQIWILPKVGGTTPRYEQKPFPPQDGLTLVVSPDGREGSLTIGQDMDLYRLMMTENSVAEVPFQRRHGWIQLIAGRLRMGDLVLEPGDGLACRDEEVLTLIAEGEVEALVFDLV